MPGSQPVVTSDISILIPTMATRPYGGIDYSNPEIADQPQANRLASDRELAGLQNIKLSTGDVE